MEQGVNEDGEIIDLTAEAAGQRERAVESRELAVGDRETAAQIRERTVLLREDAVREREEAAGLRDANSDSRDDLAVARDEISEERDRRATIRDDEAARVGQLGSASFPSTPAGESARERARAASDRTHSASDRIHAGADRTPSLADRVASADDRRAAAGDLTSAYIDELTGVLRRGPGLVQLQHEVDRAHRENRGLVVGFLDVDTLKSVNDSLGHLVGDELLAAVADALRANLRSYDPILRYGGDEFICALSDVSLTDANKRLAATNDILATTDPPGSVTIGTAELRAQDTLDSLIERADADLYERRRKHLRDT